MQSLVQLLYVSLLSSYIDQFLLVTIEWYHGWCIGVQESDHLEESKYFCQACQLTQLILDEPSLLDETKETELSRFPSEEKDIKEEDIEERIFTVELASFNPLRPSNPPHPSSNPVHPLAFKPFTPAVYPAPKPPIGTL